MCGVPADRIVEAARLWGTSATGMLLHARGHRAPLQGCRERAQLHQPGPGHRQVRQARLRCHHDHRPGQRPGRPRAGSQVRPAARQPRHHQPRAPRYVASVWGCDVDEIPGKGITAEEIIEAIHEGEIKGLLSICFNPVVSLPDSNFTKRGARQARVLRQHRLLPVRDRPARRHRVSRLAARGGRGHGHHGRGPHGEDQRRVDPPGNARRDWEIFSSWPSGSAGASTSTIRTPKRSSTR
jgi:assimilatory nitrate reductase catalytic subunit